MPPMMYTRPAPPPQLRASSDRPSRLSPITRHAAPSAAAREPPTPGPAHPPATTTATARTRLNTLGATPEHSPCRPPPAARTPRRAAPAAPARKRPRPQASELEEITPYLLAQRALSAGRDGGLLAVGEE